MKQIFRKTSIYIYNYSAEVLYPSYYINYIRYDCYMFINLGHYYLLLIIVDYVVYIVVVCVVIVVSSFCIYFGIVYYYNTEKKKKKKKKKKKYTLVNYFGLLKDILLFNYKY